jgi:peptide subunit release factor 1 (eRF1)
LVAEAALDLDAARDRELVERALDSARGGMRGTAGIQATEAALAEARVDTLVLDAGLAASFEQLVRRALDGGARVAAVTGRAAELLASVEGSAALLRY